MPPRTNERQQIILMLRELLAGPDTVVTESKELWDDGAQILREVDVVAEMTIDGEVFIASYEVTNQAAPVDVTWVEHFLSKHERLSTDRLYLVPWNGATPAARTLVATTPGVTFIDPQVIDSPDGPVVQNLLAVLLYLEPREVVATIERTNGEELRVRVEHDYAIYSNKGEELESAGEHCNRILGDPDIIQKVLSEAQALPEREELKAFVVAATYAGEEGAGTPLNGPASLRAVPAHLRFTDDEGVIEYQRIKAIEIAGDFRFSQSPLTLELRMFAEQHFGHGRVDLGDVTALAVATVSESENIEQIRVRFERVTPPGASEEISDDR